MLGKSKLYLYVLETDLMHTVRLAKKHGVKVGAHPAYPDLQGFGRRSSAIAPAAPMTLLRADLHRFKAFIEMQEIETGAWRGVIEDGEVTHVYASGLVERVPLPDGTVFLSAGRLDFAAHPGSEFRIVPDVGRSGNVAAFCAALAG